MSRTIRAAVASETHFPADSALDLSMLLDPVSVIDLVGGVVSRAKVTVTGCRIEHIRYQPRASCVISYSLDYNVAGRSNPYSTRLYARAFDNDGYPRAVSQHSSKSWVAGALLTGPVMLARHHAILYEFPNDARLAQLTSFAQPATLLNIMQQIAAAFRPGSAVSQRRLDLRLLRYKPESRCVLSCSVDCDSSGGSPTNPLDVVLRTARGYRVEASHRVITSLYSQLPADAPVHIPKPLFFDPKLQISAVEWVEGEKLSDLWSSNQCTDVVKQTGRGLAWLHRMETPASQQSETSGSHNKIEDALTLLESSNPPVASHVQAIREMYPRASEDGVSARTAWIHGDFHPGQVLSSSGPICFIDFDSAKVGEAEQDLGNFAAQLRWLKLLGRLSDADSITRTFLENYESESGFKADERRTRLWCATGLVELAAKQYRRLKPNWITTVPLLLSAAQSELGKP